MGRPPAIQDEDIKELLRGRDKIAYTTGEVADELDVHRKTAHKRLKKLKRQGDVVSEPMSQAEAWYLKTDDPIISYTLTPPAAGISGLFKGWESTAMAMISRVVSEPRRITDEWGTRANFWEKYGDAIVWIRTLFVLIPAFIYGWHFVTVLPDPLNNAILSAGFGILLYSALLIVSMTQGANNGS